MMRPQLVANPAWLNSKHNGILKTLSKSILQDWFPLHTSPPETLFHYTTAEGLLGIIKSNTLWATNVGYMNDSSELQYTHEIIQEILQDMATRESDPVVHEFYKRAQRVIGPDSKIFGYYISCFCEEGDLLSQWRGYAERGGGYAIGFRAKEMLMRAAPSPHLALRKVIYDPAVHKSFISEVLQKTVNLLRSNTPTQDIHDPETSMTIATFLSCLRDHLNEFYFSFKNAAFREENEWRLVRLVLGFDDELLHEVDFRTALGVPIPYIKLDVSPCAGVNTGKLPITSIRYGPTIKHELIEASLRLLLRQQNYASATVMPSGVPLRF